MAEIPENADPAVDDDELDEVDEQELDPADDDAPDADDPADDAEEPEGDEPDADPAPVADPDEPAPARSRGRAGETIAKLRAERRELRRERDELRARTAQPADPYAEQRQRQAAEEAETRALQAAQEADNLNGGGVKVAEYYYRRGQRENAARLLAMQNQTAETSDRADFRALCAEKPAFAAVRDDVERIIATQRAQGNFTITREVAATFAIGQRALQRAAGKGGKIRDRAAANRQRQTVRAPRGGSDTVRSGRRKPESEWTVEDYERNAGDRPI